MGESNRLQEIYSAKTVSPTQVEVAVDELWKELFQDGALRQEAITKNIDLTKLDNKRREEIIEIRQKGSGVSGIEVQIIVAFLPLAAQVAQDLWKEIILPRLKERFGRTSLPKVDS